jgi:heme-degrading monooxygenase HmoA
MIVRVVRMYFTEAGATEFLQIFNAHQQHIRNFPGCRHLELWQDADHPFCYLTYSHWQQATDLENYRKSELFEHVWGKVKPLFRERPQAFSAFQRLVLP